MWDVWTPIAGLPVAFEPPSASFALDWRSIRAMRERGITFATITLAAGLPSPGDPELDRRLPLDEPYRVPETTASAIRQVSAEGLERKPFGVDSEIGTPYAASSRGARRENLRFGKGQGRRELASSLEMQELFFPPAPPAIATEPSVLVDHAM